MRNCYILIFSAKSIALNSTLKAIESSKLNYSTFASHCAHIVPKDQISVIIIIIIILEYREKFLKISYRDNNC